MTPSPDASGRGAADLMLRQGMASEAALAEVCGRTDEGFRWLLQFVAPKVKGLLLRRFGPDREITIEDAIVEAAETLWLRGAPYDPKRGTMVTWLHAAASRLCLNVLRAEQARPFVASLPGGDMARLYESTDGPRSVRIARLLDDLRDCMKQLTEREQEILYARLSGFDGTDRELGDQLGTSANVIRVTRSRALEKLARLMRRLHGDPE